MGFVQCATLSASQRHPPIHSTNLTHADQLLGNPRVLRQARSGPRRPGGLPPQPARQGRQVDLHHKVARPYRRHHGREEQDGAGHVLRLDGPEQQRRRQPRDERAGARLPRDGGGAEEPAAVRQEHDAAPAQVLARLGDAPLRQVPRGAVPGAGEKTHAVPLGRYF